MNKIIEVAKNIKEILKAEHITNCPICSEKQWSPFDKLYTETYDKCIDCSNEVEIEEKSKNIFKLIETNN